MVVRPAGRRAQGAGDRDRHHIGICDRRQIDKEDVPDWFGFEPAADLKRQPGLASPAGARQRHQPVVPNNSAMVAIWLVRPTKLVSCTGSRDRRMEATPQRRELCSQVGIVELQHRSGRGRSRSAWEPRSTSQASAGSRSITTPLGHPDRHGLSAVGQIAQPSRPVDRRPGVVGVIAERDLPGVHPDTQS